MRLPAVLATVLIGLSGVTPAAASAEPLTNLAHLNFLGATVSPPAQPGHTTYRLSTEPAVGVLWTYADRRADGHYERIGGGAYDPATGTYSQGAYNADDIARASVVYLRHWRQTGDGDSRSRAYEMLRGLTYLQTTSGADAGNVVLWMQPDGALNRSARPVELPDPSDSGPSYWLARTVWALGEGYAAFRGTDFGNFLRTRMDLAVAALDRQVLSRYGEWLVVDGARVPAWLIVDGADATAEAVLGLSAYVEAGGDRAARSALTRLAEGVAAMSGGTSAADWPYGAILPWGLSRSMWHGWGAQMPAALARASAVLHRPDLREPAVRDAATFTPYLLTAGGADNGWLPTAADRTQIAYGVDSRVQSLVAVGGQGARELAGIAAGWYFGANAAGVATYDPVTGRTADGVSGDGVVNRNAGAESTIHGLLSMLALDADPALVRVARDASTVLHRESTVFVEGESAELSGGEVVTPPSAWTGESQWSGGAYVRGGAGAVARWTVPPADQPRLVSPVVDLVPGAGTTSWSADRPLGTIDHGRAGAQGSSLAPGALLPVTLRAPLPSGASTVTARFTTSESAVDGLLLRPEVSQVVFTHAALLQNAATTGRTGTVILPGASRVTALRYDGRGHLLDQSTLTGPRVTAPVAAGGFTVLRW